MPASRRHGGATTQTPQRRDVLAGLNTAVSNIPDAMATALLVGVNPIHGLYAGMVGPVVGGLFSSTPLMVITTTSAAALAAGQAIAGLPAGSREGALFLMVILIGAIQILAGVLRLGWVVRFVSYSVMSRPCARPRRSQLQDRIAAARGTARECREPPPGPSREPATRRASPKGVASWPSLSRGTSSRSPTARRRR